MVFFSSALSSCQQTIIDPTLGNTDLMFIDQNYMREIVICEWKIVVSKSRTGNKSYKYYIKQKLKLIC